METKPVWTSKIFWLNIITAVIAVAELAQAQPLIPLQYLPYLVFAVGVLNIVIRIWFTDKPVTLSAK